MITTAVVLEKKEHQSAVCLPAPGTAELNMVLGFLVIVTVIGAMMALCYLVVHYL